jgi:hypothetical protein
MRRSRSILLVAGLSLAIAGAWLWWMRPKQVDMAAYAPADSLLYLEANHPIEVIEAISGTQAWKELENIVGSGQNHLESHWLQDFVAWTGIGPVKSVILARAQVAVVVTELRTAEEGESLNIKPEGALLIETHTSEGRIKPLFEEALKTLAEKTYGSATSRRVSLDGVEYNEWLAPEGSRQIVGTVVGSLIIIGTSEHVVQECLVVTQGGRPSLKDDPALHAMRLRLEKGPRLTFGYVPPANSAKLLAVGLPILLGRAPGDSDFQRLATNGAAKVFGSVGWTSRNYLTGIEDQYAIDLQPSVLMRLQPTFAATNIKSQMQRVVPNDVYSVTSYKFRDPGAGWQSLSATVSSQVDALSAIVFSSLLKSALLSYGIAEPETFLGAVAGEVLTLRLDENGERSILIAGVRDRATLRKLLLKTMSVSPQNSGAERTEAFADSHGELSVNLSDEFIVMGSSADVRRYSEAREAGATSMSADYLRRITFFGTSTNAPNIATYTNDVERIRSFFFTVMASKGAAAVTPERIDETIAKLPYSVTETILDDHGIVRTTRSPLGQFSTLLPLLLPQQPGPVKNGSQTR